jgi:hypothetical protein
MDRAALIAVMTATAAEPPLPVDVPKWGRVYVKPITVAEVEDQAADTDPDKKNKRRMARAAARVICDEAGNRVFDPDDEEHVALLAKQPWSLLRVVLEASDPTPKA